MNILQIIRTLIEAIVMTEVLLDKDITTPDGASLGRAADIELDLMRGRIWVMVDDQGRWISYPVITKR